MMLNVNPQHLDEMHLEKADDVTRLLSHNSYSANLNSSGVSRADGAQLASNCPCEDRFNTVQQLSLGDGREDWIACTVFDGHNGWQMAEFLKQTLLTSLQSRLSQIEPLLMTDPLVEHILKRTFIELDDNVIKKFVDSAHDTQKKLAEKMRHAHLALSGSCAILVLYNPTTRTLYTACTGDSRAVLGQPSSDGVWEQVALSFDQSHDNENEITRIQNEHPGEEPIQDGRVLGMAVYRAFGDSPWKIPFDIQHDLAKRFWTQGAKEKETIPTPPYLIAEPDVTITKLTKPCFVMLASDGVWDECSSDEAVDLVVRWLQAQPEDTTFFNARLAKLKNEGPLPAPIKAPPGFDFLQRWDGFDARFWEERTTVQDLDNVAVHLLRNVCGGNHEELLTAKLAARPPQSRNVRDDMTVQVIFFN